MTKRRLFYPTFDSPVVYLNSLAISNFHSAVKTIQTLATTLDIIFILQGSVFLALFFIYCLLYGKRIQFFKGNVFFLEDFNKVLCK